jgi:hypothetical protein
LLKVWESRSNRNRHFAETSGAVREASVKKRQAPTKSKRSPHGAHPPQASPDEVKSAQEWEAETPEAPAVLECESEELPDIDEETKVVLLPVNPYLVHVYWGIGANDLEEIERVSRRPGEGAQLVLRFYDITHANFDGTSAPSWFDVEIDLRAGKWYVHLQSPAKSYCIDLGLRTEGSGFHRLARSNVAETPRAGPSDKVEESYLLVEEGYHRVETVVPPVKPTEVVETLPEPPSAGEQHHGEEKGQGPKELRIFRTDAPGEIERKLAELYQRPLWERSGFAPKAEGTGDPQPSGKQRADLTELSERNFRAGLSWGRKSS